MFTHPRNNPTAVPRARSRSAPPLLSAILLSSFASVASANHYAMQTSTFLDRPHLQATIQGAAAASLRIQEMAVAPSGDWIVVTDAAIEHSPGFDPNCLAKVQEYVDKDLEIDVVAFTPSGGWMVIAEHLAWHSAGLSFVDVLEQEIVKRIDAGKRIDDLAFDSDGSGWTLLSEGYAYSVSIPSDLYDAILERHASKRSIQQVEVGADGRWVLLAEDWFASDSLSGTAIQWLKTFQQNEWGLDRVMLAAGGSFVLSENDKFVPDMTDPIRAIEYGLAENIWVEMAKRNIAGLSLAIIDDNEVRWARTYGEIEAGTQRFLRSDTPMDCASVSKPIAAMTLMSLVEDGVLSLETDLQSATIQSLPLYVSPYSNPLLLWLLYGPLFQNGQWLPAQQMTLRRLLSHSASLEPWASTSYLPGDKLPTTVQMLFGHDSNGAAESYGGSNMVWFNPFILGNGTPTPPGSVYRYSGGGFLAAQAMAETLTLKSFTKLAQTRILDVLDMDDSTFVQPLAPAFASRAAVPHDDSGAPVPASQRPIYPWSAAGGLYSTPSDLARATIALMNKGVGPDNVAVLKSNSVAAMLTQQAAGNTNYGLGLSLSASSVTTTNNEAFTHNGGHTYASTRIAGNPTKKSGFVVLISSGSDEASKLRDDLYLRFQVVYGW